MIRSGWIAARAVLLMAILAAGAPFAGWAQDESQVGRGRTGDGSNAFSGLGAAPEANLFHGAATMSVPIEVPPGRQTMTPSLALSYSSSGRMTPYGYGWDLGLGMIQRSTRDGVPLCGDGEDLGAFVINLPGSSSECRLEFNGGNPALPASGSCEPLVRQTAIDIQYEEAGNFWRVRDVSGITYTFGETLSARVGSNVDEIYVQTGASCSYTFGWGLNRIEDTNGNNIDIHYGDEATSALPPAGGVLYPRLIEYGGRRAGGNQPFAHNFAVEFTWEMLDESAPWITSIGGFEAKVDRLLEEVRVVAPGAEPFLRRYELTYAQAAGTHAGSPPLLSQVALFARNPADPSDQTGIPLTGVGGAASTTLVYQTDAATSFQAAQSLADLEETLSLKMCKQGTQNGTVCTVDGDCPGGYCDNSGAVLSRAELLNGDRHGQLELIDMNGDGVLDIVEIKTESCSPCGVPLPPAAQSSCPVWTVYPGGPEGWSTDRSFPWDVPVRTTVVDGTCMADYNFPRLSRFNLFGTTQRVLDIDGDSIPDLVTANANDDYWEVRFGRFDGYEQGGAFPLNPESEVTVVELGQDSGRFLGGVWEWPSPGGILRLSDEETSGIPPWHDEGARSTWVQSDLLDMNGDGLVDYVEAAGPHGTGTAAPLQVWYNTGDGFKEAPTAFPVEYSMLGLSVAEAATSPGAPSLSKQVLGMYDMNGDGLPDQVVASPLHQDHWKVWINDGTRMIGPYEWQNRTGTGRWYLSLGHGHADPKRTEVVRDLFDINGDGLPDIVEVAANESWKVWLNRGNEFAADPAVWTNAPFPIRENGDFNRIQDTVDVDGDGMVDHVGFVDGILRIYRNGGGAWCATGDDPDAPGAACATGSDSLNVIPRVAGHRPHLLREVHNGIGGATRIDYRPSNQWEATDPPEMPFVSWTVSTIERSDGLCADPDVPSTCIGAPGAHTTQRNYVYADGRFDAATREFRGFRRVEEHDAGGNVSVTYFHQSRSLQGRTQSVTEYAADPQDPGADLQRLRVDFEDWRCRDAAAPDSPSTSCGDDVPVIVHKNFNLQQEFSSAGDTPYRWKSTVVAGIQMCGSEPTGMVSRTTVMTSTPASGSAQVVETEAEYTCGNGNHVFDKPLHLKTWVPGDPHPLEESWNVYEDCAGVGCASPGNILENHTVVRSPRPMAEDAMQCPLDPSQQCRVVLTTTDEYGNVTSSIQFPGLIMKRIEFDTETKIYPRRVTTQLDSGGRSHHVEHIYDPGCGTQIWQSVPYIDDSAHVGSAAYPNLPGTTRELDPFCRVTAEYAPEEGGSGAALPQVRYAYFLGGFDGNGTPRASFVTVERREPNAPGGFVRAVQFSDALGRSLQSVREAFISENDQPPAWRSVVEGTTAYDARGLPHRAWESFSLAQTGITAVAAAPAGAAYTERSYDALGRVTRERTPQGHFRDADYSIAWQTTTTDECWGSGDCVGARAVEIRDGYGRVVERQVFDEGVGLRAKTRFTWDGLGRQLTSEQWDGTGWNPATRTVTEYDSLGRRVAHTEPATGTWVYAYDLAGNLRVQEDPATGQHLQFCYDHLGRVLREYELAFDWDGDSLAPCAGPANPQTTVVYEYDSDTGYGYGYGIGKLHRVTDASGETAFPVYDVRGRPETVEKTIVVDGRAEEGVTTFTYDEVDRVTNATYPDGEAVTFGYDPAGQLHLVASLTFTQSGNQTGIYVSSVWYDLYGRTVRLAHGNTAVDERTYRPASEGGHLESVKTRYGSSNYLQLEYTDYTRHGMLESVVDVRAGSTNYPATMSAAGNYSYDGLKRLVGAENPDAGGGMKSYAYDALGNLTLKEGLAFQYDYSTRPNRPQSVTIGSGTQTFSYDGNGNRENKNLAVYDYDRRNRMKLADLGPDSVESVYDYTGRRVAKVVGERVIRYFAENVELERANDALDPPGSGVSRKYYDAAGLRVAGRSTTLGAGGFAEVPGPEPAVMVAAAGNGAGVVIGVRDATLQGGLSFGSVVLLGVVLLPLRGGRGMRRLVRGARTIGVAVVFLAGSAPVPWMLVPIGAGEAFAGGSGGGGGGTSSTVLEHYHHDRLGSTLLVTNWAGVVQQHVRYDAWGKVRGRWSVAGTAMAAPLAEREFTTYETEVETGLQYAGARFYDPEYGMFATLDPARQDANAYGYAGWNPVNATDPNGEIWGFLFTLAVGFLVGFTATFGGMMIGGASVKDAARAGAVAGAVAAVMAVVLQPVMGPMVDNVAKWFAGNVEKPALGYRLLAAGCFAAPSASLGAATGDWSGVIAFGLSAGILVAGNAGARGHGGLARAGGENETWYQQLGDAIDLAFASKKPVEPGTGEFMRIEDAIKAIPNESIRGESLQRLQLGDYFTYEQRWGAAEALTVDGKTYLPSKTLDFPLDYLGYQLTHEHFHVLEGIYSRSWLPNEAAANLFTSRAYETLRPTGISSQELYFDSIGGPR